ncbi:MAG TPA: hypothetical protein VGX28_02725 [Frankiaceae bacterium]|jgi:hypothetical protein|nr:hypothetical protein [Frankiaceae bacterium]
MTVRGGSRYAAAALAVAALAGCEGGARPVPPAPLDPDAAAIRAAAKATLAACPCRLDLTIGVVSERPGRQPRTRLVGVYDPVAGTFDAREHRGGRETGMLVRVVGAKVYARPSGGDWVAIDHSGASTRRRAVAALLAFADPGIVFAVTGAAVTSSPRGAAEGVRVLSAGIDTEAAAAAAGPWGATVRAWVSPALYGEVELRGDRLGRVSFLTTAAGAPVGVTLESVVTGVEPAGPVEAPPFVRTVDAAIEELPA